jgi:hypothetical protein
MDTASARCPTGMFLHPKAMAEIVVIFGGLSRQAEQLACPDEAENAL